MLTKHGNTITGTVASVDINAFTANISVDSSVYFDVPLRVLVGSQASVIEIPIIGSTVLMCFKDGSTQRPQILAIDQTDQLLMNCNLVEFNKGQLGGMVKVIELTAKLNKVENDLNNLKTLLSSWIPVPSDGGAALKTIVSSWSGQQIIPTQRADIENTKILQ